MKDIIQEIIERDFHENFDERCHIREYSGRAMYGKKCLGVVVRQGQMLDLIAHMIRNSEDFDIELSELADAVSDIRYDNMGLDEIVYFPTTPFTDEDEDEYDDDEDDDDDKQADTFGLADCND